MYETSRIPQHTHVYMEKIQFLASPGRRLIKRRITSACPSLLADSVPVVARYNNFPSTHDGLICGTPVVTTGVPMGSPPAHCNAYPFFLSVRLRLRLPAGADTPYRSMLLSEHAVRHGTSLKMFALATICKLSVRPAQCLNYL